MAHSGVFGRRPFLGFNAASQCFHQVDDPRWLAPLRQFDRLASLLLADQLL